jgi:malate dehydrogenase (oxaloacetate-decarboxylating)(NADP+)
MLIRDSDALEYHSSGRKGKIEVVPTKPCRTQRDLSMAYTPGVAVPCNMIHKKPDESYRYTAKGNLVAVITNGTAVLGLGNIGALAGKPVMEGKGVLFKRFADIDVFDIELSTEDPDEIIKAVKLMEPTFGGINLEDIKAPECFYIEEKLIELMDIPVFHDDQHGTAIISAAGLLNALEISKKKIDKVKVIFCGAGAAGIACAKIFLALGVKKENVLLIDTKGVIYKGRKISMNPYKEEFAMETERRTLADAMKGADVFVGVSVKGLVTKEMVRSMNDNPIVFAMANPDPEITYHDAKDARDDVIMATGRSDYPNQVNNVLGFPFIFRGALDVQAKAINMEMKIAAAKALANLAKEDVPDEVIRAYGDQKIEFGPEYIIPKPFDPRVLLWEAPAVAEEAMKTKVARKPLKSIEEYKESLESLLGRSREVMRVVIRKAKQKPKRIVFPEGEEAKVQKACQHILDEKIAIPILLGNKDKIKKSIRASNLEMKGVEVIDPQESPRLQNYTEELYSLRKMHGMTPYIASRNIKEEHIFGMLMVHMDEADGLVCGINMSYADTIRPALQIIKLKDNVQRVSGMYCMILKDRILFFADATVNIEPSAEDLAEICKLGANTVKNFFNIEPKIAMLSFSNFGSTKHPLSEKVREATEIAKTRNPDIIIDGEMMADTALVPEICKEAFPHSKIVGDANVLVFPDLQSGNVAYKLVQRLADAEIIGPILMGMKKPVNVLNHYSSVSEIVNITAITAVAAEC